MSLYFDHTATTEPASSVVACMLETLTTDFGNPSSLHRAGLRAERKIEQTRGRIAKELGCSDDEVIFTSGGTEASQLAIAGTVRPGDRILTTAVEHSCVHAAFRQMEELGAVLEFLPVEPDGTVSLEALQHALAHPVRLLSVQHVNNEVGTVQPIEAIGTMLKQVHSDALFHVDGVQAFGKFSVPLQAAKVDLYAMSAHKINGPKGIGALYARKGVYLKPLLPGGGQEKGRRGGTQNVPGIVGFGEALKLWQENREAWQYHAQELRAFVIERLSAIEDHQILSPEAGSPYILTIGFTDIKAEVMIHMLEQQEIYVSSGSACGKGKVSHVLQAMGVKNEFVDGAIRLSFSHRNTKEDAAFLCDEMIKSVAMIRQIKRKRR